MQQEDVDIAMRPERSAGEMLNRVATGDPPRERCRREDRGYFIRRERLPGPFVLCAHWQTMKAAGQAFRTPRTPSASALM